jgi:hypothetical protein
MLHALNLRVHPAARPGMGGGRTLALFGGAAALFIATRGVLPLLVQVTGLEPLLCWFVAGGLVVFLLLSEAGFRDVRVEGSPQPDLFLGACIVGRK